MMPRSNRIWFFRAVVELFGEPKLAGKIALRGGTSLNKLFIRPQCRYPKDIDLVQTEAAPIGPILDAIRAKLDPWLGKTFAKGIWRQRNARLSF